MLEFWTTALYNPSQASADSFLVNHSTPYTAAALFSSTEFILRFLFVPHWHFLIRPWVSVTGLAVVAAAQALRALAMATAGCSFHHIIQTQKRSTHVLITHGVYKVFRHPSYVGFFYWSIASQVVLGNVVSSLGYTITVWNFFYRRIAFEEESLQKLFSDEYPAYARTTYIGIPFLRSLDVGGEKVMSKNYKGG